MRPSPSTANSENLDQAPENEEKIDRDEDRLQEEVEEDERARRRHRGPYRKAWTPKTKKRR